MSNPLNELVLCDLKKAINSPIYDYLTENNYESIEQSPSELINFVCTLGRISLSSGTHSAQISATDTINSARWRYSRATITSGALDMRFRTEAWSKTFACLKSGHPPRILVTDHFDQLCLMITLPENSASFEHWYTLHAHSLSNHLSSKSNSESKPMQPKIDRTKFLHDWGKMVNTHQFGPLLRKYKLSRH